MLVVLLPEANAQTAVNITMSRVLTHREIIPRRPDAAAPDLPLHDIRRELAARNVRVGYGTIWRFFAKEKITFKKIVCAAEQQRPDVAARRKRWQEDQEQLDPKRLVFIDETWAKTNMAPAHGRCRRGQRLYAICRGRASP